MSKNINIYLGPAVGLSQRNITITRMMRAGDDSPPAAEINANLGSVDTTTQVLPDNEIWEAVLTDTLTAGGTSTDILHFQTGSLSFPGPRTLDRLNILSMEDLSSSSSSSVSSISTSSSSSSSISTSSSSVSSISTSSSSISTSSSSSSSISDSSSSSSSSISSATS